MDIYEQCKSDAQQHSLNKVDVVLESLDKKDAESLRKALLDPSMSTRTIERVLRDNDVCLRQWAINSWRKENGVKLKSNNSIAGKK